MDDTADVLSLLASLLAMWVTDLLSNGFAPPPSRSASNCRDDLFIWIQRKQSWM